jgi:hypothetical protein
MCLIGCRRCLPSKAHLVSLLMCAQWNHSGCSFTEMFAFIKRKSDAKAFMIYFLTFTGKITKGHFIHTVHILIHGHFTDLVSAWRSRSMTLTCVKTSKETQLKLFTITKILIHTVVLFSFIEILPYINGILSK